jgi:hypothetical protein
MTTSCRIAAVPPFPGLRRFPQGRNFKQWTGDDSKALMKVDSPYLRFLCIASTASDVNKLQQVILPALQGHVPRQMIASIHAFLEFCYLIRRESHTEQTLNNITRTLRNFHQLRQIFVDVGVLPDGISLPRQHSIVHYRPLIEAFGSPNGLCSSITESKHIKAVKEPWRRSNKYKALSQMLVTNQRLEKLASIRAELDSKNLLSYDTVTPEISALEQLVQAAHIDANQPANANNQLIDDANQSIGNASVSSPFAEDHQHEADQLVAGSSLPRQASMSLVEDDDDVDMHHAEDSQAHFEGEASSSGDGTVEEDSGPVDGTRLDAHAELARKRGESSIPINK